MLLNKVPVDFYKPVNKFVRIALLLFLCGSILVSCSYDKGESVSINDGTFFDLINTVSGFQYYKRTTDTLVSASGSPHGSYMRVRFNQTAVESMNSDLSSLTANRFADGSIGVKEIYDSPGGNLKLYAAMFKTTVDANTGGGWIWAEYGPGGDIVYSTNRKGADCTGCHSASGNQDLVRTFSLH